MTTGDATTSIPRFTSDRERRLWLWTLVAIVGIYSTLGLARTLADTLVDRDLLVAAFLLGMILTGASIVALRLRRWPRRTEVAVALGVGAVYLMVFQRMGMTVERSHLFEYSVVAVFIHEALRERAANGRAVPAPALLAILATTMVGVLDELIQLFLPFRVFDPVDMFFNSFAAVMAVVASLAFPRARAHRPMTE